MTTNDDRAPRRYGYRAFGFRTTEDARFRSPYVIRPQSLWKPDTVVLQGHLDVVVESFTLNASEQLIGPVSIVGFLSGPLPPKLPDGAFFEFDCHPERGWGQWQLPTVEIAGTLEIRWTGRLDTLLVAGRVLLP